MTWHCGNDSWLTILQSLGFFFNLGNLLFQFLLGHIVYLGN